jgi:AcrR family transcriptional regulator
MRVIPTTSPRRRPRQARAQATVDAIIKATARVLIEEGYDRASTNRIAQAAGVSIGSLYQYFPSKEALVASLVENQQQKMTAVLEDCLAAQRPEGLGERADLLVRALIRAYRVDAALDHVLCQEVPKVGELQKVYGFEEKLAELCRTFLFSDTDVRSLNEERATFVIVNAVPGVIRAAVQSDRDCAADGNLAAELTDMIVRYLS